MRLINRIRIALCAFLALAISASAAEPAAEQLLPGDTAAFLSIRDVPKFTQLGRDGNLGQLWADPVLKPFRSKFEETFSEKALAPIEKALGLKLQQVIDLTKGQATVAVIPQEGGSLLPADFILILDSGESSASLTTNLTEWARKWNADGRVTKTEKVRDTEFMQITLPPETVNTITAGLPGFDKDGEQEDKAGTNKVTFFIGQSKSLLLVSSGLKAIEKIVAKQQGAQIEALADKPVFEASRGFIREGQAVGWASVKAGVEALKTSLATMKDMPMAGMKPDVLIKGLGLDSVTSLSGKMSWDADGRHGEYFLAVPEADRKGLFKVFEPVAKDATPPVFVAADVLEFTRARVELKKSWETIENTINLINPAIGGLLQMTLASAGKDKDPQFDLKKNLVGNLGDDVITISKASPGGTNQPQAMSLVSSPNANELLGAIRTAASLLPTAPGGLKEREFLGRKIYSFGGAPDEDGEPGVQVSLSAHNGYLAVSASAPLLEEYLRATEAEIKPLKALPGLAEAAEKIGGTTTGFFSYTNDRESMRATYEGLRKNGVSDQPGALGAVSSKAKELEGWFDWSLLPPYEQVSKYLHFSVSSLSLTAQGYFYKEFAPTPPGLRK